MKKRLFLSLPIVGAIMLFLIVPARAQQTYSTFNALTERLKNLASEHKNLTNLQSLATSPGGGNIWVLTIGKGDIANHPALAVIGGAKGSHILGSELAVQFAERLLNKADNDSIQALLQTTTFYIMPRINPDATEEYFSNIKYERDGNASSTDDDRDGAADEDGFEDLNGDGLITMMRVKDESGSWAISKDDKRMMTEADSKLAGNERYRLLSEGRDNDHDESFNEDGRGGVNINKNFTYDYPYFQAGAGENMASQPETRAVLDFLYDQGWNVFALVSFGPENNLSSPLSFNSRDISKRVVSGWYEEDVAINKRISDMYNETTTLSDAPAGPPQQGDLFQWAYYHYGRLSFSTPGWWTPPVMNEEGKPRKFDDPKAHTMAWAESENIPAFVDWQQINHPDFPNQKVEVGGLKPFSTTTPPYSAIDSLAKQHTNFLISLAGMHPQIELNNVKTESVGRELTRITVDVYNAGAFPTSSKIGERTRWVRGVSVELTAPDNMSVVSGRNYQSFDAIGPHEHQTLSWLIRGNGSFSIKAGAPNTGFSTIEQTIK